MHISYISAMEFCAKLGNISGAGYFIKKSNRKQRIKAFLQKATSNLCSHMFLDLIGTLDVQKVEVIKSNLETALSFILSWPYQMYFIDVLDQIIGVHC